MPEKMAKLETELADAKREVEELKRDKERLDWLHSCTLEQWEKVYGQWGPTTIRQAIDNAMKEEK